MSNHFFRQPASRQGVTQALTTGAAAVATPNPFGSSTIQIRLSATSACFYLIFDTTNVIAATAANAAYLPANVIEYVTVQAGQKLSAIEASATGTITITEVS